MSFGQLQLNSITSGQVVCHGICLVNEEFNEAVILVFN